MRDTTKQVFLGVLLLAVAPGLLFAQPTSVSYQGQLEKDGSPHNGQADLKFVIVDGGASLWSNDGTSVDGAEPSGFVTLEVAAGLFQVLLGGAGMQPLTADLLAGATGPQLRIWVRAPAGADGFEQLTDQAISSVPFSLRTEAGGTGESLWQTNGTDVYRVGGNVGVGTNAPQAGIHVAGTSPRMRLQGSADGANYLEVFDGGGQTCQINLYRTTGTSSIDMNPRVLDETSNSYVRLFRSVISSGAKLLEFYTGDGTPTKSGQIGAGGANSYFQLDGGNFGIGTSSPSRKLDVAGTTRTEVLEITGADLVESFDTRDGECSAGDVVVIDQNNPGQLKISNKAYDARVAGVVSGAGGIAAGIHLGKDSVLDGNTPVAMTGRVYVNCTTENGPIKPGDRLTTSDIPGYAMNATDRERADGAVLGKAMTALESGVGLVLVLVNLQ